MITINLISIEHKSSNEGSVASDFRLRFSIGSRTSNNININLAIPRNSESRIITKEIPVGMIENVSNLNSSLLLKVEPISRTTNSIGMISSRSSTNSTEIQNWQSQSSFEESVTMSNGTRTSTIIVHGTISTNMVMSSNFSI